MFPSSHLFVIFSWRVFHVRVTPVLRSFSEKGSQLHFDGIGITFANANKCRRISGPRRRPKVEEKMRKDGREADVCTCCSRSIIYSCVCCEKFSDANVYVRSDYFLPLAPISHANLRNRQKLRYSEPIRSRAPIGINCSWAIFFGRGRRSLLSSSFCRDSSRLITCSTV